MTNSHSELEHWFLTAAERGNPSTAIDRARGTRAWTEGNSVRVLIDGAEYFPTLLEQLRSTEAGDWLYLTDLESDGDERLAGEGTEIGAVLADAARRGTNVRGLLWRSHPMGHSAGQVKNLLLSRTVNEAGGELVLDNRVRRGGSHHQKIVVIERASHPTADDDLAFVGGIDLAHGRRDGPDHRGDEQAVNLGDARYGERPPWHDVQLEIAGPAVADIGLTFRERWEDPSPLDVPTPWRALRGQLGKKPSARGELAPPARQPGPRGTHAVQVLRTYPARRRPYPFAKKGERSIARAYSKAFANARSHIYIEDQYFWSLDAGRALCDALRRNSELRCVVVIPRFPDPAGRLLGGASRYGRMRLEGALRRAGPDRVAIFDLENDAGTPIYVHAKVCVVDDIWMTVGSDNLNRRSWAHDSEISCALIDTEGTLARNTRLRLAREHLADDGNGDGIAEPKAWFNTLAASAHTLDEWHAAGATGARPPGHLRRHPRDRVPRFLWPLLHFVHSWVLDPDGRPSGMRRSGTY